MSAVEDLNKFLRNDNKRKSPTITAAELLQPKASDCRLQDRGQLIYATPPITGQVARRWNSITVQSFHMSGGESVSRLPWVRLAVCRSQGGRIAVRRADGCSDIYDWPCNAVALFPAEKTWHMRSEAVDMIDIFQDSGVYRQIVSNMSWFNLSKLDFIPDLGDPVILNIIGMLEAELKGNAWGNLLFAESLSYSLAINVVRVIAARAGIKVEGSATAEDRLPLAIAYIQENLDAPISLEDMARESGLTIRQLGQTFKAATGMTPHQFVLFRRISQAKFMLQENKASLTDIAYACGFSSQAHFTTRFREIVGVLPSSYRRVNTPLADLDAAANG
ncbi:MAG TPA: AraC family transcriptional regulator [Alphaproteobacteria bacterium]|nr:AraC family transcriptional regulator [Alphaproteobacteria bacterium]